MVEASAAAQHGPTLEAMNSGRLPGSAVGGWVNTLPPSVPMVARGGGGSAGHTVNFGDVHIHPVGGAQFTSEQINHIQGQVAAGQQQTAEHITRTLTQIQADSGQTVGG